MSRYIILYVKRQTDKPVKNARDNPSGVYFFPIFLFFPSISRYVVYRYLGIFVVLPAPRCPVRATSVSAFFFLSLLLFTFSLFLFSFSLFLFCLCSVLSFPSMSCARPRCPVRASSASGPLSSFCGLAA